MNDWQRNRLDRLIDLLERWIVVKELEVDKMWVNPNPDPTLPEPTSDEPVWKQLGFGTFLDTRVIQLTEDEMIFTDVEYSDTTGYPTFENYKIDAEGHGQKVEKGTYWQVRKDIVQGDGGAKGYEIIGQPGDATWISYPENKELGLPRFFLGVEICREIEGTIQ